MIKQISCSIYPIEDSEVPDDNHFIKNQTNDKLVVAYYEKREEFEFMPYSDFINLASHKDVFDYVEMHSSSYYSAKFTDFMLLPDRNYVFCSDDIIVMRKIFNCLKKVYILSLLKLVLCPLSFLIDFSIIRKICALKKNIRGDCSGLCLVFLTFFRVTSFVIAYYFGSDYFTFITGVVCLNGLVFEIMQICFCWNWPWQINEYDSNQRQLIMSRLNEIIYFRSWFKGELLIL